MEYTFWFIFWCILLATLFGILIGWLWRTLSLSSRVEALERCCDEKGGSGKSYDSEIADHGKRIKTLEDNWKTAPKAAAPQAAAAAPQAFAAKLEGYDALKEISGVGKVLEKRLNT
ncbi:MAG TPA: hypothetical protein PKV71_21590, partial [Calditrichia bacterium]|nr:hypothetical protein [Calditrichia bacterium]